MIAIDWGTSSLRAYRVDAAGHALDKRSAPLGIMQVSGGAFAAALHTQIADWLDGDTGPIVMSGMIGSRQGWREAPYVSTPAALDDIARAMVSVDWNGRIAWIAPGVSTRSASGVADVMRGEETQLLGAMDELPRDDAWVCLPGTHSKWVNVVGGRILSFSTHMTGEVFAVLRQHSILARLMPPASEASANDADAFTLGLRRAAEPGGLLHHLFGVRAQGLFGELSEAAAPSYLSGLLIGHELAAIPASVGDVYVLGNHALNALYAMALERSGRRVIALDPDAALRGLIRLAERIPGS